jgi:predicted RNA-binding Zn-ribbon protein involved in translation (DUF1610 family)
MPSSGIGVVNLRVFTMIQRVETDQYVCDICEFAWIPRLEGKVSKHCPNCGSRKWNKCGDVPDFEQVIVRRDFVE